ncbi:response regulator [Herbidospora mongoliensis]|uniref:response regulator n=1 Tax=Herbidospora mongoliensis TaxID=688067 RepID=UPI00082C8248|nr:response regulator transcription factor [Herbidospora mongoliensis]
MIRVLLADDQHLVRGAFAMLIGTAPDMEVAGQAATGRQAVDLARITPADLVVMDIRMPDLNGIEATRAITSDAALSHLKVLILTTYDTDDNLVEALRAGASGFVVKDTHPAELLAAIRTVAAGDALLSPGPTRTLIARALSQPSPRGSDHPSHRALAVLSDREKEVLTLVAQGLTNHEIGAALDLSPLTAKKHVSRIMGKLHCRDRAQLVITAYETHLVTPHRQDE